MSNRLSLPYSAALLLHLFMSGCSAGSGDGDHAGGDGELSLRDICDGTYDCVPVRDDKEITTLTFSWLGNTCFIREAIANGVHRDDLNIPIEDVDTSITGTRESFRVCDSEGNGCSDCYAVEATAPGSAHCKGNATPCSSIATSSCSLQSGCQYRVGVDTTSTRDDDCGGTARDCDEIDSQSNCKAHRGCYWE